MSDSNYENRQEEKNSPTLSDMTIHILTRVVNELDFLSRTKLQKTCHGFQDFINSHNSTCDEMILTFTSNFHEKSRLRLELSIDKFNVQYIKRQNGCSVKIEKEKKETFLRDTDFLEIGLADFKSSIKNPNFKIKKLFIRLVVRSAEIIYNHNIDHFFNKLSKTLESLDRKINVEKLNIHTYNNEKYAYSVLKFIKPGKLDEIFLGCCITNNSCDKVESILKIDKLTSLEQWKMAKSLKTFSLLVQVESIIHFDEFSGTLTALSPENIVFLKEVYLQSDTFKKCYIETNNCMIIFQYKINIEAVNQLLGPVIPFDRKRPDVRRYPIPNSNQWFLMKITPTSFHIYRTDSVYKTDSKRDLPPIFQIFPFEL